MAELLRGAGRRFRGAERAAPAAAQPHAALRQRRRLRRRRDAAVFEAYFNAVDGRPNTRGGDYHINLLPTTCHVYFGSVIGATPDGRRAGDAAVRRHLAGAGRRPPRADRRAPLGRQDGSRAHRRHAAQPEVHAATAGRMTRGWTALVQLVRAYFKLDGHHIQFNVVDCRHPARGAGAPRAAPRPDRARGGLQRLLLRPLDALQTRSSPRTEHRDDAGALAVRLPRPGAGRNDAVARRSRRGARRHLRQVGGAAGRPREPPWKRGGGVGLLPEQAPATRAITTRTGRAGNPHPLIIAASWSAVSRTW